MRLTPCKSVCRSALPSCKILRIKEKPFECGPEEGKPENDVAGARFGAVDDGIFLDDADAEAGEIVIGAVVHAGHLCGFAADQSAAGLHAPLHDARDDAFADADIEFPAGVVIQEKQGLGALHDHVVGAHGDQIDAHAVRGALSVDGQAQFGADAIGSRYQHRFAVAIQRHLDQSAEAADAAQHLGPHRAFDSRLDSLDKFVAGVNIDPGVAVGHGRSFCHSRILHVRRRPKRRALQLWYFTTPWNSTYGAFLSC